MGGSGLCVCVRVDGCDCVLCVDVCDSVCLSYGSLRLGFGLTPLHHAEVAVQTTEKVKHTLHWFCDVNVQVYDLFNQAINFITQREKETWYNTK